MFNCFCDRAWNAPVKAVEQKWSYRMHPYPYFLSGYEGARKSPFFTSSAATRGTISRYFTCAATAQTQHSARA